MKTYKDFEKQYIGSSDIASLILVGCAENGLQLTKLPFGEDGTYWAYIVDENDVEIGAHYKEETTFRSWLKIYDDSEKTYEVSAKEIRIYRAGDFGCIIHLINKEESI